MKSENYGTVICGECGTRVSVDDAESSYNAELDDVVFYCTKCINNPDYMPGEDDETQAESDFSDEYTKRCGWCLEMNKESSSFCWACAGEI